jgi:hypothetical protein
LLKVDSWRATEAIVVGGGFRASRIGELAIGRAGVLLKASACDTILRPIHHDPEAAGLLGCARLFPHSILAKYDALLAVDIGGAHIRTGLLKLKWRGGMLVSVKPVRSKQWRHGDSGSGRDAVVQHLADMLSELIAKAVKRRFLLAPIIGVGCPGLFKSDGTIERGAQNLPGNWEAPDFNLPHQLQSALPEIGGQQPSVFLHNDAVVQGLSELPYMAGTKHWGVLTIGTGLGHAQARTDSWYEH